MKEYLEKAKEAVSGFIRRHRRFYRWVNREYIERYLEEVKIDIEVLRQGMQFCKFERDKERHFQFVARKYEKDYCPCTFREYFSEENQLRYLLLRAEITDILSRKDQFFSDFQLNI